MNNLLDHWSAESQSFTLDVINLARNESSEEDVSNLINITTRLNYSEDIFTDEFAMTLDPYIELDMQGLNTPPSTFAPNLLVVHTWMKYRLLRQMNPTWSKAHCAWEASKEIIHLSLDGFGLIPVGGEVADLINGVLYTIEGDGLNATLSFASAIPVAGWATAGTKFAIMISGPTKFVWKVTNNVIEFGDRAQLRKVLGLAVGDANQAHHLIPWSSKTKMVIQRAAKSGNKFHMNEALNGIVVEAWRNQPNHNAYNSIINLKLDNFRDEFPNATPQQCHTFVTNLINEVRIWIINNPTKHLNELVLP